MAVRRATSAQMRCYHCGTAVLPEHRCGGTKVVVIPRCRRRARLPRPEALLPPRRCCRRMTALLSWWWRVAAMLRMCCCRCGGAVRAAMSRRRRRCCMAQGLRWCCPRVPTTGGVLPATQEGAPRQERMLTAAEVFFFQRCFNIRFVLLHLLCGFATI